MQKSPVQPGVQWQAPSSALQLAPLWQLHVWKQAEPQNPDGQAVRGVGVGCREGGQDKGAEGKEGEAGTHQSQDTWMDPERHLLAFGELIS